MRHLGLLIIILILSLVGCRSGGPEPRLDTRSEAALQASLEAMGSDMSAAEKDELASAVVTLMSPRVLQEAFQQFGRDEPLEIEPHEALRDYHGLTAPELIDRADDLWVENE